MMPSEMEAACLNAIQYPGLRVTFNFPRGHKLPPGFPRGELLSEVRGNANYAFKPEKVLRWLRENLLIEAVSSTAPSRIARGNDAS